MTTTTPGWTPTWTMWTWVGLLAVLFMSVLALWMSAGPYLH